MKRAALAFELFPSFCWLLGAGLAAVSATQGHRRPDPTRISAFLQRGYSEVLFGERRKGRRMQQAVISGCRAGCECDTTEPQHSGEFI